MVPFVPEQEPDLSGRRVYLSAGLTDPIVTRDETERLSEMLQRYRADVTLSWVKSGHQLITPEVQDARIWINRTFMHSPTTPS
jgi:phospholipase/carboxylesterase